MPYYLRHFFQPDFNHTAIRPAAMADGTTHDRYLGFVQSVVAGQTLAELIYLDSLPEGVAARDDAQPEIAEKSGGEARAAQKLAPAENPWYKAFLMGLHDIDPRFVYNTPVFPLGPNCARDTNKPNRISALINGFCFYHQGLITVKRMLNVRQDVNFRTGNIIFASDILVHGDVYPGFRLTGNNIRVKGRIDGGVLRAGASVVAESVVKGAPTALIDAKGTVRVASCEQARIITPGNCIIDGNCMYSELFVGGSLIVKGRLQGGVAHAGGLVYVKNQLGDSRGVATRLCLGYAPEDVLSLQTLNAMQEDQSQKLQDHTSRARKGPQFAAEAAPYQELATAKLEIIKTLQRAARRKMSADPRGAEHLRVIVPGAVYPGVEISIGRAYSKIIDECRNVFFRLNEDEIESGFPALAKGHAFAARTERDAG
ncbi:MAG: FapA family protein, partial [Deltaproteobacteria bacterium]|jgi:uncharacterized protein (DUF342 family)|nr:FapA family protein [Deltaproteobacteria bacterium]